MKRVNNDDMAPVRGANGDRKNTTNPFSSFYTLDESFGSPAEVNGANIAIMGSNLFSSTNIGESAHRAHNITFGESNPNPVGHAPGAQPVPQCNFVQYEPVVPGFRGTILEDPREFLKIVTEWLIYKRIPPYQWANMAIEHLKGQAAKDFGPYKDLLSFEQFRTMFWEQYAGPTRTAELKAVLFGQQQTTSEKADLFILRKWKLWKNSNCEVSEDAYIPLLIEQLKPNVRIHLRRLPPQSFAELLSEVRQLERDLPKQEKGPGERSTMPNADQQLPLCRFCPNAARHWHRDCPNRQGNANGTEQRPVRSPQANRPSTQ